MNAMVSEEKVEVGDPPPTQSERSSSSPTPTRRRGSVLEEAILAATRAELAEHGYQGLTMEGVAARAQTSKPVVYRRWSSRAKLAIAAIQRGVPAPAEAPDTGALRTDLLEILRIVARRFEGLPQGGLFGLLADSLAEPEQFELVQRQLTGEVQGLVAQAVDRAADRGEIRSDHLSPRALRVPADMIRSELYLSGTAPSDAFITETVDLVLLPLFRAL